jgi:paraquat-inducible protein B
MTKRPNPTAVGGFILGAIALVVVGIVVFGSGSWFRARPRAVAYFQGNIAGLNVGAPVTLRGVPIGTVTNIQIEVDEKTMVNLIPVYLEFEPERFTIIGTDQTAIATPKQAVLKDAVAHGLHAKLATQSFVTGQLAVELSFDPDEQARSVGANTQVIEIPTALSEIEKLKDTLTQLPLDKLGASALHLIDDIDRLITGPETTTLLRSMSAAGIGIQQLMTTANTDLKPLIGNVNDTLQSARDALTTAQAALKSGERLMSGDLRVTLRTATAALERAETALSTANTLMATSQQRYDLDETLRNLSATSQSLRSFADELDRRPNSLLMGK